MLTTSSLGDFFSFREKEKMSLTEKTDIRDSDEKVVEIEMERLDKKKCSSQFTLSSDCIRRFCEKYRTDMMRWIGLMNNIRACVDEIVLNDIVCS